MEYALNTKVEQEIFIDADEDSVCAVKYTITITNTTADTDAECVTVKAVLGENLSWYEKDDDTDALYFIEDISNLAGVPEEYNLDELTEYVENHIDSAKSAEEVLEPYASAVVWADQTIAAGEEKEYVFYAMAAEGITTTDELSALYFVDGELVENTAEDQNVIQWKNEGLLAQNETEAESETEIQTEVTTESGLESEAETEAVPETETESEAESETESETEMNAESETETETSLTYEGADYTVTVTYGEDAMLPEGVELLVSEYANDSETWLARYAEAVQLYALETFRLFNIGLYVEGEEIEPAAAVSVAITLPGDPAIAGDSGNEASAETVSAEAELTEANVGSGDASEINTADAYTSEEEFLEGSIGASVEDSIEDSICVIHFGEESGEESASVLEIETEYSDSEQIITFSSDSFSDYGIAVISDEAAAVSETEEENTDDTISTNLQALINLAATATANVRLVGSTEDASWEETTTAILTAATDTVTEEAVITLYADFTENLEIPSGTAVMIVLNGHSIAPAHTGSGSAITVNGTLTLTDSSSTGTTDSSASAGALANSESLSGIRGVLVASGGSFTLDGGTISGFSTSGNGGGVLVNSGGSFTMTGGTIANNTASGYGGGIYLEDASDIAAFTGGTVSGNTANRGGGVAFQTASDGMAIGPSGSDDDSSDPAEVDTADKVLITENVSTSYGGGIYAVSATKNAVIQNTVVSYNTSAASGGGIYFPAGSSVSIYYTNADNNVIYGSGSMTGGGICVESSTSSMSTLVMVGGTASSNTVTSTDDAVCYGGGVGMGTYASATMTDVTADRNSGVCKGGGIAIRSGFISGVFTNLTVTNNTAKKCATQGGDGGGLWTDTSSSTAVVSGGTYTGNYVQGYGAAMYIYTYGKIIGNVTVADNTATSNGGIFCRRLTIGADENTGTNVEIYENTASSGGGISAHSYITIQNATVSIHDNTAKSTGGGIHIGSEVGSASYISGNVEIYNNTGSSGGGIGTSSNFTGLTITDSVSIHDNTATSYGGGIYVVGTSGKDYYFNMTGGSVYNNTANYGGGIYVNSYVDFTMTGGSVTGNTANTYGGGVYMNTNDLSFVLNSETDSDSGETTVGQVYGNSAILGQDVYAAYSSAYANTDLQLIAAEDMFDDDDGMTGLGWLDEARDTVTTTTINYNPVKKYYPLTLKYETDTVAAVIWNFKTGLYDQFTSVQKAVDALQADKTAGTGYYYTSEVTSPEVILVDDTVGNVEIPGSVTLTINLNGYTLKGSTTAISCSGTLTIKDVQYTTGDAASSGSDTYCAHYSELLQINQSLHVDEETGDTTKTGAGKDDIDDNTYTGTITGTAATNGGGIYIYSSGDVTMESGQIADCVAGGTNTGSTYGGAGVYIAGGTFTLTGTASINNCSTKAYGSAVYVAMAAGKFIMSGGTIEGNSSRYGAVYVAIGTFKMTDGAITGNSATYYGGGIYLGSSGKLTATGGSISENTAATRGGGIYMEDGTATLSGVEITDNTVTAALTTTETTGAGGGIYMAKGTLTIKTGTKITGNTAARGGGIFQSAGTATMSGGQITGNTAEYGGVAQNSSGSGTFTLSGGVICDNTSNSGGGNDVYSTTDSGEQGSGSSKVTLIRAAAMEESGYTESYNVWEDDTYSGSSISGEYIGDGQYVTGTVTSYNGVQLTAAVYGETEETEAKTSELYVKEVIINGDEDYGIQDGEASWDADGVTAYATDSTTNSTWSATSNVDKNPLASAWTPGSDSGETNGLVRSFDTVTYYCMASCEITNESSDEATLYVQAALPLTSDEAELVYVEGLTYYELSESDDGSIQYLTGYTTVEEMTGKTSFGIAVNVKGMKNGELVKPTFSCWIEENASNKAAPVSLTPTAVTVSATGRYNITLLKNSELNYTGYFDLSTGEETTKSAYESQGDDGTIIYGTMLGYGITLSLWNTSNNGLKGVEIPEGEISFDLSLKSTVSLTEEDNETTTVTKTENVAPYIWAYKANENTETGSNLDGSIKNVNMNWNDEDDTAATTQYAYDGAPYNSRGVSSTNSDRTCYSGGAWTASGSNPDATDEVTTVSFTVSGYTIESVQETNDPYRMSNGSAYSAFNNNYTRAFSAGYIQVIVPVDEDFAEDETGYVSIDTLAIVSDLTLTPGPGGIEDTSSTASSTDETAILAILSGWYADTNNSGGTATAKNEIKYADNYASQTTGLYVYEAGDETLIKTNYFRNEADSANIPTTQLNGNGSTLLGSQVYIGSTITFSSSKIDSSTMQDEQDITNTIEYNYLTAVDLLQKFDANAYTPIGTDAIVNETYSLTGQNNYITGSSTSERFFRITTSESATDWTGNANKTYSYTLTILYAAKPNGQNWTYNKDAMGYDSPVADMDNYTEDELIYFTTLNELYAYFEAQGTDGVCVGILYEFRDCCIRTGRTINVVAKMQVTNDFDAVGNTYCITNDLLGWTTYRPTYKDALEKGTLGDILYDFNWYSSDAEYGTSGGVTAYGRGDRMAYPSSYTAAQEAYVEVDKYTYSGLARLEVYHPGYIKTEYSGGYMMSGTHISGYYYGNTLLIYTLESGITIEVADKVSKDSNDSKYYYNLGNGEYTANFTVTPTIYLDTSVSNDITTSGDVPATVVITITLPENLNYNDGTLSFDYSTSGYEEGELSWDISYVVNTDGTTTITVITEITDVTRALPQINYSTTIGSSGTSASDLIGKVLTTTAEIYVAYESDGEKISTDTKSATAKIEPTGSVQEYIWIEGTGKLDLGEKLIFSLYYYNKESTSDSTVEVGTLLPYNGDTRGTSFDGAYQVTEITLTFTDEESYLAYLGDTWGTSGTTAGKLLYVADGLAFEQDNDYSITNLTAIMNAMDDGTSFTGKPATATSTDESGNTVWTITYTLTDTESALLTQYASETAGIGIYAYLPSVSQDGTVTIDITMLTTTTDNNGTTSLLEDNTSGSVQEGGNIYWDNIFYRKYTDADDDNKYTTLLGPSAYIIIVERALSGIAWLDQDRDGKYNTTSSSTDLPLENVDVYLYTDTYTDVSSKYDYITIEGVYEDGSTTELKKLYRAVDVLGNLIDPVATSSTGLYMFENLPAGTFYVVFVDENDDYTIGGTDETPIEFSKLSVTDRSNLTSSGVYNKSQPTYGTTNTSTGETLLSMAYISNEVTGTTTTTTGIELPTVEEISGAIFVSSTWNGGFYYIELELEKVWENIISGIEEGTAVTFEVTGTTTDSSGTEPVVTTVVEDKYTLTQGSSSTNVSVSKNSTSVTSPTVTVTNNIATDGTVTWTLGTVALQAEDATGEISYSITESAVETVTDSNGTVGSQTLTGFVTTLKTEDDSTSSSTISVTATNTQILYALELYKISTSTSSDGMTTTSYLSNATFTLYTDKECTTVASASTAASSTSGADASSTATSANSETGKLYIGQLAAGTYYLKETVAPSGYELNQSVWKIDISYAEFDPTKPEITVKLVQNADGKAVEESLATTTEATTGSTSAYYVSPETSTGTLYTISFQMEDEVIYSLPQTGSIGIIWPTLAGTALMLAALVINERKRWMANA